MNRLNHLNQLNKLSGSPLVKQTWTPLKPLGGETPSYWYQEGTRSGLTLPNSVSPGTGDKTITLPHLGLTTTGYAYVNDNGAMDIINNLGTNPLGNADQGFTLCGWANNITASKAGYKYLFGKPIAGSIVGRYGILANITTGYVMAYLQSSGGYVERISTIDYTGLTWPFLLMDVNYTTKVMRLFVNNVQIGADVSFTGTLSQTADVYRFYCNVANANTTGNPTSGGMENRYKDVKIYNKILTPAQQTTIYSGGFIDGAVFNYPFSKYQDTKIIDSGTGGKHLLATGVTTQTFDQYGSRQALDLGYTRFKDFPNKEIQVPYNGVNSPVSGYTPTGYTKDADVAGSVTEFNKADSYIAFAGVDRSDTTQCSYLARKTNLQHYYNSGGVSLVHGVEFNNKDISNYFTTNYRGLNFIKANGSKITDIITYATNKTGADYERIIRWTTESILKFDVIVGPHICAVKGAKVLKFDDINTLSLSNDNGSTYPITLLTTCSEITDAFFYDNGNIGWSDNNKCYYSDDNLATYQESTVLGIDGNPFVAGTLNNFRAWMPDTSEAVINTVHIRSWGCYATGGTSEFNNINQWYTIDGGATIKSAYKFGTTLPSASCRHIHQVTYDTVGNKWYMTTGDGDGVNTYNHLLSGDYNTVTDAWAWTIIASSNDVNSIWQSSGMCFDANYLLVSHEINTAYRGIMRILRTDVANIATNQELIFATDDYSYGIVNEGGYYIMPEGMATNPKGNISFSADGERFFSRIFTDIPLLATWGGIACRGKLDNGYYVFSVIATGETLDNYTKGSYLLIKPSVIV